MSALKIFWKIFASALNTFYQKSVAAGTGSIIRQVITSELPKFPDNVIRELC